MAFVSLIEFASGEFAGFEFAREEGALLAATELVSAGIGQAQFDGGADANASFDVASSSVGDFLTKATASSQFAIASNGTVTFAGTTVLGAVFEANSRTLSNLVSGIKRGSTVAMEGFAGVDFYSIEGFGFDITSGCTVEFFSGATINSELKSEGASQLYVAADVLASTSFAFAGTSTFTLRNEAQFSSSLTISGKAASAFHMQAIRHALLNAGGSSGFIPIIRGITNTAFAINSSGLYVPVGYSVANATMASNSNSTLILQGHLITPTDFNAAGITELLLNPGNPVYTFLPDAYDVVYRPKERRMVIRPKENRTARWR